MPFERREALERLSLAIAQTRQRQDLFTTMMLRLTGLRALRKHVGYEAADAAADEARRRLELCLPAGDWVGRVADDEFLIVSYDCNSPSCAIKGSEFTLHGLAAPLRLDAIECALEPHVGIALFPADGDSSDELLRHALAAVDQAEEADTDPRWAFFSHEIGQRARADFATQQALRRAISKGEFALHLQPQFALSDGRLVGAEALLRWPRPEGGLCPPSEFIPVAERGRLMRPLGRWVFDEALRVHASMHSRVVGHLPLAVNVAADQLASDEWVRGVTAQVEAGRVKPADLVFEITESVALHDGAATTARLQCLHDLGFKISVDDFGTGYSNLAALARFPFDEVKIDRSLVAGLGTDEGRRRICRAVASLGRELGMVVLAEGVETAEQAAIAGELGCQRAQGFLYGRPIAVDEFEARWLTTRSPPSPPIDVAGPLRSLSVAAPS
jgi:EAL domain-containing protein (putative c-di-GMP-specific phosphodiesterase class I)/GGDEF domain-containing protein